MKSYSRVGVDARGENTWRLLQIFWLCRQCDENLFDCVAAAVASRILRVARLGARASVPPLTRPLPPGSLLLGFHRGSLSIGEVWRKQSLRDEQAAEHCEVRSAIRWRVSCVVAASPRLVYPTLRPELMNKML